MASMAIRPARSRSATRSELLLVDDLTRTQIVQYAGASGDYNPLHTDEKFATEVAGYPGVFAHGMLTMGMTGRMLTDWFGDGRLTKYGVRFVEAGVAGRLRSPPPRPSRPSARRTAPGSPTSSVVTVNQDGDMVVTGSATARLDP